MGPGQGPYGPWGQDPYGPLGPLWARARTLMGPYGPGPGPLWALRALMGPGQDPYGPLWALMGPGQYPYGTLWARASTLMGPMGPGQSPYYEPAILRTSHIMNQPVARTTAATAAAEEFSQSIQVPSSTHPGTTYPIRTIPHSDICIYTYGII